MCAVVKAERVPRARIAVAHPMRLEPRRRRNRLRHKPLRHPPVFGR